jgi:hypothetical protein
VRALFAALLVAACSGACAQVPRQSAGVGARHAHHFKLPADKAAACFARNAEEHSSALKAEVQRRGAAANVIVRVKNGVLYATAEIEPASAGSDASIILMVRTNNPRDELLQSLVEGC